MNKKLILWIMTFLLLCSFGFAFNLETDIEQDGTSILSLGLGVGLNFTEDIEITAVTLAANVDPNIYVYIYNYTGVSTARTLVAKSQASGLVASFSNVLLTPSLYKYEIIVADEGSNYNRVFDINYNFGVDGTDQYINVSGGCSVDVGTEISGGCNTENTIYNIEEIEYSLASTGNFTISANINGFNASLNDTDYNTTTNLIITDILSASDKVFNITLNSTGYISQRVLNHNVTDDLNVVFRADNNSVCYKNNIGDPMVGDEVNIVNPLSTEFNKITNASGCVNFSVVNGSNYGIYGNYTFTFEAKDGHVTPIVSVEEILESDVPFNKQYIIYVTHISIYLRDVETTDLITENISVDLSDVGSFTTTTGLVNITDVSIVPGTYTVYANNDNYIFTQRSFVYTSQENIELTVFLLKANSSNAGTITISVQNNRYDAQVGADVRMQYLNPLTSSFEEIGQCLTDSNGRCLFNIELGAKVYRFFATSTIDNVVTSGFSSAAGSVIYVDEDSYTIFLSPTETFNAGNLYDLTITPSNIELTNNISTLTADFIDTSGVEHQVCIGYYFLNDTIETLLTETCINGSSGSVNYIGGYLLNRSFTNIAKIYVKEDSSTTQYNKYIYNKIDGFPNAFGIYSKLMIVFVLALALGLMLYLKKVYIFSIIIIILSFFIKSNYSSLMKATSIAVIIVLSILLMLIARKRNDNEKT